MRGLLSTVIVAVKVSFMPRFLALRMEHKLDDLISFRAAQNHGVFCLSLPQDLPACLICQTSKIFLLQSCVVLHRPVSSVAKRTLSVREVWGSIPGSVKSAQCRQQLAIVATFIRSCVAQALSRGDGPRTR